MGITQGTVFLCSLPSSDFAHSINVDGLDYVLDTRNNPKRVSCILSLFLKSPPDHDKSASIFTKIKM